ncbi:PIN/TRAM domain-containing protein [Candidatus Sumerlaeota bacterium]|nr:PIN/TRAM domain-containing protein [Candidatus Sumerlaeota bacterium]MBI3736098.1 PIN/TRAM domain-containing protein [Candidatus Sumerlaeota bacterium]
MRDNLFKPVVLTRLFFVLLSTWMATYLAWDTQQDPLLFSLLGFAGGLFFVLIEYATQAIASRKIVLAAFGWFVGLIFAQMFYPTFGWLAGLVLQVINALTPISIDKADQMRIPKNLVTPDMARFICHMMFGYFGLVLALRHADWLRIGNLKFYLANPTDRAKVLDSSAIIDGRVIEVVSLGLLNGPILVPNFVLNEVQFLSDAPDAQKRARGKRGLEVLDKLRTNCKTLDLIATDYPDLAEVDQKLVRLCREMNADMITNDYNLQKVAQMHQIHTINLNELSAALRPTVYIGETLVLRIVKQGKESRQGVGYLEDGSMVVVDGADGLIGQDCDVTISSILQNPSGRLIFARLCEEGRPKGVA